MTKKFTKDTFRVSVDFPKDKHDLVLKYNENNPKPLNLVTVARLAILKAIDEVEAEMKQDGRL